MRIHNAVTLLLFTVSLSGIATAHQQSSHSVKATPSKAAKEHASQYTDCPECARKSSATKTTEGEPTSPAHSYNRTKPFMQDHNQKRD